MLGKKTLVLITWFAPLLRVAHMLSSVNAITEAVLGVVDTSG